MYVCAVTARLRWPTRSPILAHGHRADAPAKCGGGASRAGSTAEHPPPYARSMSVRRRSALKPANRTPQHVHSPRTERRDAQAGTTHGDRRHRAAGLHQAQARSRRSAASSRSTRRKNGASRSSPARRRGTRAYSRASTRSARRRRRSQPPTRSFGSRRSRGVSSTPSPARSCFPATSSTGFRTPRRAPSTFPSSVPWPGFSSPSRTRSRFSYGAVFEERDGELVLVCSEPFDRLQVPARGQSQRGQGRLRNEWARESANDPALSDPEQVAHRRPGRGQVHDPPGRAGAEAARGEGGREDRGVIDVRCRSRASTEAELAVDLVGDFDSAQAAACVRFATSSFS